MARKRGHRRNPGILALPGKLTSKIGIGSNDLKQVGYILIGNILSTAASKLTAKFLPTAATSGWGGVVVSGLTAGGIGMLAKKYKKDGANSILAGALLNTGGKLIGQVSGGMKGFDGVDDWIDPRAIANAQPMLGNMGGFLTPYQVAHAQVMSGVGDFLDPRQVANAQVLQGIGDMGDDVVAAQIEADSVSSLY